MRFESPAIDDAEMSCIEEGACPFGASLRPRHATQLVKRFRLACNMLENSNAPPAGSPAAAALGRNSTPYRTASLPVGTASTATPRISRRT
jgi:hypothetical protein